MLLGLSLKPHAYYLNVVPYYTVRPTSTIAKRIFKWNPRFARISIKTVELVAVVVENLGCLSD